MEAASIFLDINLPNATTWFYFSALLAVALFFKFSRFLSVRNWDVIALFLLVPGLLLLREPGQQTLGYVWLFAGSAYFLTRCLLDLTLVQRPALAPNLTLGGLAWMAAALFICLVAVAVNRPPDSDADRTGRDPDLTKSVENRATDIVGSQAQVKNVPSID